MKIQKNLLYLTKLIVGREIKSTKIRGVNAILKESENAAIVTFYFNAETSDEELEDASVACAEIIAHFSNAMLEENYIRWDYPKPLPESPFWAYKKD